jgi:hypothetical protein
MAPLVDLNRAAAGLVPIPLRQARGIGSNRMAAFPRM